MDSLVQIALWVAPVVGLLLALARGRFPGERVLERVRRPAARRRRPAVACPVCPFAPERTARSGRLLGSSLAIRPPPVSVLTLH